MKNSGEINNPKQNINQGQGQNQNPDQNQNQGHIETIGTNAKLNDYDEDSGFVKTKKKSGFGEGGIGKLVMILIPVAISFALILFMTGKYVTKDVFTTLQLDVQGVHKTIDGQTNTLNGYDTRISSANNSLSSDVKSQLTTMQSGIDKTIADKMNSVINTALSGYAKTSDLSSYSKTGDATTTTTIAGLRSDIDVLKADVAKLKSLPTPTTTPTPTSTNINGLSVTVKDLGTELLAGDFGFYGGDTIKLTLKNNNTTDITDLRLYLYLMPEPTLSTGFIDTVNGNIGISGDLGCTLVSSASDEYKFKTSRLSIKAGVTKNYYLTPSVLIKPKYAYRDKYTNLETNNVTTVNPNTQAVENNPVNITPSVSKLTEDTEFSVTYEVIDFNN